jgi:hypothetical protein
MPVEPEIFTAQPLDPVPLNSRAHLFGNDKAQTRMPLKPFRIGEDKQRAVATPADFGKSNKFRSFEDSVLLFERNRNHSGSLADRSVKPEGTGATASAIRTVGILDL